MLSMCFENISFSSHMGQLKIPGSRPRKQMFHAKYYDCHRYAVNELLGWYINYLGMINTNDFVTGRLPILKWLTPRK